MTALVDMTGAHINGLSVLRRGGACGGKPAWICVCHCGNEFQASGTALRTGRAKGCPSCVKEKMIRSATKHGAIGSREYVSYNAMKARCYYEKDKRYPRYGGRGIRVCDRWYESFANFLVDMGPKPSPLHSIERLDGDKNYEPENCIWATPSKQANNRSNNTRIEINGRTQNLTQWAKETGVNRTVILRRMKRGISGHALIIKGSIN